MSLYLPISCSKSTISRCEYDQGGTFFSQKILPSVADLPHVRKVGTMFECVYVQVEMVFMCKLRYKCLNNCFNTFGQRFIRNLVSLYRNIYLSIEFFSFINIGSLRVLFPFNFFQAL